MTQAIWSDWGLPPTRIHSSDVHGLKEVIDSGRPALVEGVLDAWPALSRWNFDYITSVAGDRMVPIEFYPNGTYYERWLSYEMKVRRYLELITSPRGPERYYMAELPLDKALPELATDVKLPPFIEQDRLKRTAIFLGKDTISGLHYHDVAQALLCQVVGEKRVLLFSPDDFRNLYFDPWYSSCFNFSLIDFNNPDMDRFPALKNARPSVCVLKPGDALFIPIHWGHIVEGEGNNASVTFFWRPEWRHWRPRKITAHALAGYYFRSRFLQPLTRIMESQFRYHVI